RDWGTVSGMIGCDIKNPPVCFLYQYTGGRSDWIDTLLWGAYETNTLLPINYKKIVYNGH
ncbi:MAG: hypothetical protein WAV75_01700, partial [Streptococcus suis]